LEVERDDLKVGFKQQVSNRAFPTDTFNLQRFLDAQRASYDIALAEILAGRKREHWVWYIFPQLSFLGESPKSKYYGISSLSEAKSFAEHPVLGERLLECFRAMLTHKGKSAIEMLGSIDADKLRSCATLFSKVMPRSTEAEAILGHFYSGEHDPRTELYLVETAP